MRRHIQILYGLGDVGITIPMVIFGLFVLFFYNSVLGLPGIAVGVASAVGLLWDAAIDPYIGYRSDRRRGRWGRRHPYMLAGSLTMGVSFWLLMSPPPDLQPVPLFGWLLVTTVLFRFTSALFRIPYLSLGAELSQDYHGRTSIVGIRAFFGLCGTLAAGSLSFLLFFPSAGDGLDPKLNYASYPALGVAYGVAITVAGLVAVVGTFRHRSPAALVTSVPSVVPGTFLGAFWSALGNRAFRAIWLSLTLFFLAAVINAALAIHYLTWYVGIVDSTIVSLVQGCFYLGALAGVVFWVRVGRRREKHRLLLIGLVGTGSLLALATLLFGEGHLFGTGNPLPLVAGNTLAGFMAGAMWVLPGSMLADVADADELEGGHRREGLFFGLLNFGEKIAGGISLLVAGGLLDFFVKLVPGDTQSSTAIARIGLVYGLLPAMLLAAAAWCLSGYRLDRRAVLEIQAQLQQRRVSLDRGGRSPVT